jgi:membrane protein DedA with SNARE-associated domain
MTPLLRELLGTYGYAVLFLGTLFEGETVLIMAGFAAHSGYLRLEWVMLVAFVGGFSGDQIYFIVGRFHGKQLLRRRPRWRAGIDRADRLLARYGTWFVLGFRFLYGLRTITPVAIGLTDYPARRFVALNALGAAIWASSVAAVGYLFGASLQAHMKRWHHLEVALFVGIAVVGLILTLIHALSARHRTHLDNRQTPSSPSPSP